MGLGYRTGSGTFATTCVPAARALMLFSSKSEVLPSLVTIGKTVRCSFSLVHSLPLMIRSKGAGFGYEFERHVRRAFMGASQTIVAYTMAAINKAATNRASEVDEALLFLDSTFTIKRFDEGGDLKNATQRQVLYIPESSIFKAWDLIIHTPPSSPEHSHRVIFIQISTKTMRAHDGVGVGGFLMQNSLLSPMAPKKGMSTCTIRFLFKIIFIDVVEF